LSNVEELRVFRIDHVYVSDQIEVLASGTFEIPGSDHRGVWADLAAPR
jgi:endonuclease/exonuclease/phosphatase family metal-dependent hydrolase